MKKAGRIRCYETILKMKSFLRFLFFVSEPRPDWTVVCTLELDYLLFEEPVRLFLYGLDQQNWKALALYLFRSPIRNRKNHFYKNQFFLKIAVSEDIESFFALLDYLGVHHISQNTVRHRMWRSLDNPRNQDHFCHELLLYYLYEEFMDFWNQGNSLLHFR